jgi:hypothetical protein
MIDFYMFATDRGNFTMEGLLNDQEAIDIARRLGGRGETVFAIFKDGQLWLKEDSLEEALIKGAAESGAPRQSPTR